jgi:hypothetical protein
MSRHVPRRDRWTAHGPIEHRSVEGLRAFYERGAWWAEISYRLRPEQVAPEQSVEWVEHTDQLGPFKRPRNAMVEAERHATFLQRRHGDIVALGRGT